MASPTHISQVPRDDIETALAFYAYAREHGLPMAEVAHGLLMLQTTSEGGEALAKAVYERWPGDIDAAG